MSSLLCKICGFETFEAYALKKNGRLICPQCSTFYHSVPEPLNPQSTPAPKFKFKIQPKQSPETA
jgi:uncharacterized Zn finger protein (UPF0148 family)